MFVVIEGIEGSGKSTLLAGLAQRSRSEGRDAVVTREPGGTPLGDAVRKMFLDRDLRVEALTEAFLVNAARAQHVAMVIRPALQAGRAVLCDRFTDSTLAYQGYGRGLDLRVLRALCDAAAAGVRADLVLVLDLPVRIARARMQQRLQAEDRVTPSAVEGRELDRIEAEDDAFHERVRLGFIELARSPRHRVLDGTRAPEDLLEEAWSYISTS